MAASLLLAWPSWSEAPLSGATGARPLALGQAFVGLANDASALFINQAGLTALKRPVFNSLYAKEDVDNQLTSLAGVWPDLLGGTVGLGWRSNIVSNIQISAEVASYITQDLTLAYSRKIRENLSLGAGLRSIAKGLSVTPSGYETSNGSGMALDLSCKYDHSPQLGFGLALQNLAGSLNYQGGSQESLGLVTTLGCSWQFGGPGAAERTGHVNLDLCQTADSPLKIRLGVEWLPAQIFAVRLGLDQTRKSAAENYTHFTYGIGLKLAGFTVDYTAYKQGDQVGNTINYLSIGYVGETPPSSLEASAASPELKHFPDVPAGYWAQKPIEYLATSGLINWYPDGTFRPEQPITRAEAIMLLVRLKGYALPTDEQKKPLYPDVPATFWAADYIQAAKEHGLINLPLTEPFRPREPLTLAEGQLLLGNVGETDNKIMTRADFAMALFNTKSVQAKIKNN